MANTFRSHRQRTGRTSRRWGGRPSVRFFDQQRKSPIESASSATITNTNTNTDVDVDVEPVGDQACGQSRKGDRQKPEAHHAIGGALRLLVLLLAEGWLHDMKYDAGSAKGSGLLGSARPDTGLTPELAVPASFCGSNGSSVSHMCW
jgi:hypothetical protein